MQQQSIRSATTRAAEFVALENAIGWKKMTTAVRLGVGSHQVRRWRLKGAADLEGKRPPEGGREAPLWAIHAMRAWFALKRIAPGIALELMTREGFLSAIDSVVSPALLAGERRPDEYGRVIDGADITP